jgi:predicted methyltransferase
MSRHSTLIWFTAALALTAFGCKGKDKEENKATTPTTAPVTAPVTTPKTVAPKTVAPADPVAAALAHANRPQADKDRDAARKPAEVLAFYGVKPGMKVADLFSFSGYYTEILGRVVGPTGKVISQNNAGIVERFADLHTELTKRLEDPELAKAVEIKISEFNDLQLPGELDAVFLILAYHDMAWIEGVDRAAMNKAIFDALKPGGVYAVIDHHGAPGNAFKDAQTLHRGDADLTKTEILAAGFEFAGESDILAVPEDKRDTMAMDAAVRGKTDRFVYKFIKPAAAQ